MTKHWTQTHLQQRHKASTGSGCQSCVTAWAVPTAASSQCWDTRALQRRQNTAAAPQPLAQAHQRSPEPCREDGPRTIPNRQPKCSRPALGLESSAVQDQTRPCQLALWTENRAWHCFVYYICSLSLLLNNAGH